MLITSIGNGVAKEFICMTDGHEQWWGNCLREQGCWAEVGKGGKIRMTTVAESIKHNLKNLNKESKMRNYL